MAYLYITTSWDFRVNPKSSLGAQSSRSVNLRDKSEGGIALSFESKAIAIPQQYGVDFAVTACALL